MFRELPRPICIVSLASLLFFACGGGDFSPLQCERKTALIEEGRACVEDDDCPCGSGCELGKCTAGCSNNSDCDGLRCSEFGRCEEESKFRISPVTPRVAPATVIISDRVLAATGGEAKRFTIRVRGEGAPTKLRVAGEEGLLIACGDLGTLSDGDAAVDDCKFALAGGGDVEILVLPEAILEAGDSRDVSVYWDNQRQTLSYYTELGQTAYAYDPTGAPAGRYEGTATLKRVGAGIVPSGESPSGLEGTTGGSNDVLDIAVPVIMDVFGDSGSFVVRIQDPFGAFSPSGELIAALTPGSVGRLDFVADSHVYVDSTVSTTADDEDKGFDHLTARYGYRTEDAGSLSSALVWASLDVTRLQNGIFSLELPVYYDMLDRPQRTPAAVWSLSLVRNEGVPESEVAPAAPGGVAEVHAEAMDPITILAPTRFSAGLSQLTKNPLEFGDSLLGDVDSMAMCSLGRTLSAGDKSQLYQQLTNAMFGELIGNYPRVLPSFAGRMKLAADGQPGGAIIGGILDAVIADSGPFRPEDTFRTEMSGLVEARTRTVGGVEHLDLPCALSTRLHLQSTFPNENNFIIDIDSQSDRCDELAARTGCAIHDRVESFDNLRLDTLVIEIPSDITYGTSEWTERLFTDPGLPTSKNFTRFCTMPEQPPVCAELGQCHSGEADDALLSSQAADNFFSESGDAVCVGSLRSLGLDADDNTHQLLAGAMHSACVEDLAKLDSPPAPGDALTDLYARHACLNHARVLPALEASTHALRLGDPTTGSPWGAKDAGSAIAHRLLVRWVQIHGYISHEMVEQFILETILRRSPATGQAPPPSLENTLAASLRGWDLLLHPRFASAIDRLDGATLAIADYRPIVFGVQVPSDAPSDPTISLPIAIMDALRSQVELVGLALNRARFHNDPAAFSLLAPTLRYAAVASSMAEELAGRALETCKQAPGVCAGSAEPAWFVLYGASRARANAAVKRTIATANLLRSRANPFGIEESDLPLYFANTPGSDDGRFFAISDYLLGTSGADFVAWAPPLVEAAARRVEAARAKWIERQARGIATQQTELERESRVVAVQGEYGDRIINLCGRPGEQILSGNVLDQWEAAHGRSFSATDCFLDFGRPECVPDPAAIIPLINTEQVQYTMCQAQELESNGIVTEFYAPEIAAFAKECPAESTSYETSGCNGSTGACLRCSEDGVADAPVPGGNFLNILVAVDAESGLFRAVDDICLGRFPTVQRPLPTMSDLTGPLPSSCFRGAVGEQAAAMRSVATEISIAQKEASEMNDAWTIATDVCLIEKTTAGELVSAEEDRNKKKRGLRAAKLAMDIVAEAADATADCAATVSGVSTPLSGGVAAISCGANAAAAAARSVSAGLDFAMDDMDEAFALETAGIAQDGAYASCMRDADHYKVALGSQALRIRRAMEDMDTARVAFQNLVAEADLAYDDGVFSVDFERGRRISPMTQDVWLDEEIRAFDSAFRIAHRVTYLSVRAVEYEFQQSTGLREIALAAVLPDDLNAVLQELRTFTGARSVFGSRPIKRKAILSLRDELLNLADYSDAPAAEQGLTPTERLQLRLRSPNNAVYDDAGNYLGQEIVFSLASSGETGRDAAIIFAQDSCAERLWSVNASVLSDPSGGRDLLVGQANTFTNMTIKKANTFYSQWCREDRKNTEYQLASIRPERNLFRDPESAGSSFIESQISAISGQNFSKALIQPSLDVDRVEFEDDQYENGDSSQLAARGLFGEYKLFFPADALSIISGSSRSSGLDLSAVGDILVRFDYVSAAK